MVLTSPAGVEQGDACVATPGSGDGGELVERCYIHPWIAAGIYSGLSSVIEAAAFAFHRQFTTMNDEGTVSAAAISWTLMASPHSMTLRMLRPYSAQVRRRRRS